MDGCCECQERMRQEKKRQMKQAQNHRMVKLKNETKKVNGDERNTQTRTQKWEREWENERVDE